MDEVINETFAYHTYVVSEQRPSQIDPQAEITANLGFKCPRCKKTLQLLDHGGETDCTECGVRFQLWGNGLHCSADKPCKRGPLFLEGAFHEVQGEVQN